MAPRDMRDTAARCIYIIAEGIIKREENHTPARGARKRAVKNKTNSRNTGAGMAKPGKKFFENPFMLSPSEEYIVQKI